MADEMTDFLWSVAAAGYSWGDFKEVDFSEPGRVVRVLTDAVPAGSMTTFNRYTPLGHGGLFQTFALETKPTELGIQQFANKYGTLGVPTSIQLPPNSLGAGETIQAWAYEIVEMKRLVNLWDCARRARSKELALKIHWDSEDRVAYREEVLLLGTRHPYVEEIASSVHRPDILARLKPRDLVAPAFWYVQRKINEKLHKHNVTARLLWDARDRNGERLTVHVVPGNLIGCLWLQFAKAVEGDRNYRQCENCKLWFEIGGSRAARSDKRFCTPTCKAALHRKDRERARALHTAGRTPSQIAKELGKQIDTVKGWIRK